MKGIGHKVAQCLDEIEKIIIPGINTFDIEEVVRKFQTKNNLKNSQFGYYNFPGLLCISVNEEICHGIPSKNKILKEGDIVSCDITSNFDGYHGDSCRTFPVSDISEEVFHLIQVAHEATEIGIDKALPGRNLSDIGKYIEEYVNDEGMQVVKDFGGHGIGTSMHMDPYINNHYAPIVKDIIKPGMMFTIEPIITLGESKCKLLPNHWTAVTLDGSWSAQFEHSIGVTDTGNIIFT